ncbi:MAG: MarR family transcriptional regulator [Candidatus Hodarchaeales archaeon]
MATVTGMDGFERINDQVDISRFPKSARKIYRTLKTEGAMKPGIIIQKTELSARTVRYALKKLVDNKVIGRFPDLEDLRSHYYRIL